MMTGTEIGVVGVLRVGVGWGGADASVISSVHVYIVYGSLTGRINNKVLPSHHIYTYIQHTHKSSNPIHSLSHAVLLPLLPLLLLLFLLLLLLLLLRLASLISAIPCLLETIPVHECAQHTPSPLLRITTLSFLLEPPPFLSLHHHHHPWF
jgi:hypothetical protein